MKLPQALKDHLLKHRAENGYLALEFTSDNRVTAFYGSPVHFGLDDIEPGTLVQTIHPALETETFTEPFELPLLSWRDGLVCDVHHVMAHDQHFLLLLDRTDQFDVIASHQQHSHNVQLRNDHFKRLIDELNTTQARLRKANKEKAMLIAMLSHEFGTPLSAISGYAALLAKGKVSSTKATDVIRRNAQALVDMIHNALQYGQLHAAEPAKSTESFLLSSLLDDVCETLKPMAESKGLAFHIRVIDAPEKLSTDRARLRQVLVNLLSNACKYTIAGQVTLTVQDDKKTNVTFTVTDTGTGIPADKIPRLFTPWVRGEQEQASGSGLGLVISKQLAESLGGSLRLVKTSDKGTEFCVSIPQQGQTTIKTPVDLSGKYVLLVDDDPDILYLCQLLLEEQGLFVITAGSVADACELFSRRRFDVILTDINLADGHGETILDKVRQHSRHLPVLAMSALPHAQTVHRLLQRGFSAVIPKPIDETTLLKTLHDALASG